MATTLNQRLGALGKYIMTGGTPWPAISAAAAAGNAAQEDEALPVTVGPKDHGSDGEWQWRLGRLIGTDSQGRMGLKTWCGNMGYDWTLMESQVLFMKWEMQHFYPSLWEQMINPGDRTLANLTANFQDIYEVPAPAYANLDNRIAKAEVTLSLIAPEPEPAPPPVVPIPAPQPAPTPVPATDELSAAVTALKAARTSYTQALVAQEATQAALTRAEANFKDASTTAANAKQAVVDAATKLKNLASNIGTIP